MNLSDLTPDALARLEAKLLADVEKVRRVRELLEEHGPSLAAVAGMPTPPVAAPSPQPAAPVAQPVSMPGPAVPATPRRSFDEIVLEALLKLPKDEFESQDLRRGIFQITKSYPETPVLKSAVNRLVRQGKVEVVEARTGRRGSLLRRTVPPLVAVENPAGEGAKVAETAVSPA